MSDSITITQQPSVIFLTQNNEQLTLISQPVSTNVQLSAPGQTILVPEPGQVQYLTELKQGLPGPPGPQGPPGSGLPYIFDGTATPAISWTINHNLGKIPIITVLDTSNTKILIGEQHTSLNSCIIDFSIPFLGKAYLY